MATKRARPTHNAYTIGLIYVKPLEMNAIVPMLDEEHEELPVHAQDQNEYILGRIGQHNVIVVGPPIGAQGKVTIADVVNQIRFTFKNVKIGLLVGIGGGVPRPGHNVRLGDVVVGAPEYGPAIIQYDLGKQTPDGIEITRYLNKPPTLLLNVVNKVQNRYAMMKRGEEPFFIRHLKRFEEFPNIKDIYCHPGLPDRLFQSDYLHEDGTECKSHEIRYLARPDHSSTQGTIRIHYGTILSGDLVMKSGEKRDEISKKYNNAICFEMEAAGLMDVFPCLVIRGICDYCDSHKSKEWQGYAAAVAAAYAREVLCTMTERVVVELEVPTSTASTIYTIEQNPVLPDFEEDERIKFLKMLSYPEMAVRERTVETAYGHTYEWLQQSKNYVTWKSTEGGRLLIKGKAGCGKSTLMKNLYTAEKFSKTHLIVCGFFFNNRGSPFERTTEAMLRTLIHQVTFQYPAIFSSLRPFYSGVEALGKVQVGSVEWTKDQLEDMLKIITRLPNLNGLIYIDALDEGEGFIPSEMFEFLEEQLTAAPNRVHNNLRICLSSRPDNFINHRTNWTTIDLVNQNSEDITTYVTAKLRKTSDTCSHLHMNYNNILPELGKSILQRADGVFLWVKLVLKDLQKAMNCSMSEEELFDILEGSPVGLYDLFASCLGKVNEEYHERMRQILQIVLITERPLSVEELTDFMKINFYNSSQTSLRGEKKREKIFTPEEEHYQMKVKIQNWCGGLVEVVDMSEFETIKVFGHFSGFREYILKNRVQFMHQSVKDFLQQSSLSGTKSNRSVLVEIEATADELMFSWCMHYLETLTNTGFLKSTVNLLGWNPAQWNEVLQHPFIFYSPFWIRHAERFIRTSQRGLHKDEICRAREIFIDWYNYPRAADWFSSGIYHKIWGMPLFTVWSHSRGIDPVSLVGDNTECGSIFQTFLAFSVYRGLTGLAGALLSNLEFEQNILDGALVSAFGKGSENVSETLWSAREEIMDLLIEKGADVNASFISTSDAVWDYPGGAASALIMACGTRRLSIVQKLIERGGDVNAVDQKGINIKPLGAACYHQSIPIAKLLIDHGAQVNTPSWETWPALAKAADQGNVDMIELLLNCGATLDILIGPGEVGSTLALAAGRGREEAVKLLLTRGDDVNRQYAWGSPLSAAASCPRRTGIRIMKYLIDNGGIVDMLLENGSSGSALIAALSPADREIPTNYDLLERVKLLVENGADVNLKVETGMYGSALIAAAALSDNGEYRMRSKLSIMKYLIECGARVNEQSTVGFEMYGTPLIAAIRCSSYAGMKLLIENGADANLPSLAEECDTALKIVADTSNWDWRYRAAKLLLDNGANADGPWLETWFKEQVPDYLEGFKRLI